MSDGSWIADQRGLREAVRARRRTPDGRSRLPAQGAVPAGGLREHGRPKSAPPKGRLPPLVSVIVVCWNSGEVLGRCLDHLFAQDYANFEIIVVDDGSSDNTLGVAEAAQIRGELTIVRSRGNRGCPHARNLGIRHAKGEFIAFVDADGFAACSWLTHVVNSFQQDVTVGGVASTVFFDANPFVINGAGGIVNRQGWAADLSMNEPYERAELASEALYPMGCGMALRRSALERVGPFDDGMLNYYDDVDYGMRLWRAGYRVVVAPDAWIDHGFGKGATDSLNKELLCERHRMRVVLKHDSLGSLRKWFAAEARELEQAPPARRVVKLKAMGWNARHLPGVLASRWHLRRAPRAPERLIDPSWGDGFPAGVPPLLTPTPDVAASTVDMADPVSEGQLVYGWFPVEQVQGRSFRWAGLQAAALMRLDAPARRLRLDYAHVPVDIGAVEVGIRRVDSADPLKYVWSTLLPWQYLARSVENHPLELPIGDYEVVFRTSEGWLETPVKTRSLAFGLASMSFDGSYEIADGGLDMASRNAEDQLVQGWFEPEQIADRHYRWATRHAAAVVRLAESAGSVRLMYRLPPVPSTVSVALYPLDQRAPVWSTRIAGSDTDWREDSFPLQVAAGDYLASFDTETPWTNPERRDPGLPPENRSLGFGLSRLSFN